MSMIFIITIVFLVSRVVITMMMGQFYFSKYVRNFKPSMGSMGEEKVIEEDRED
jgi:hypothetical protein